MIPSSRPAPQKTRRFLVGVLGLVAVILVSTLAEAAAACKKVNGKFTLSAVTGPTCLSPTGVCATGSYSGGLAGTSTFTGSSLVPTVDTPTTSVVLLTGDTLITTKEGTLNTKDAIVLRTTGAGEFSEIDTVIGGTGEWAGATGVFTAQGTFTTGAGGRGEYVGEVCTP